MDINNCRRILVLGDSGRGKSTLSRYLSNALDIKHIELDDIFWIKKYTQRRTDEEQIEFLQKILLEENNWIVEGSTRHLVSLCLDSADCIIHLRFKNILQQWFYVFKRGLERKDSLKETINLCIHLLNKRYGWGKSKGKAPVSEIIKPWSEKVVELSSWKEIDSFMDSIRK